MFVAQKLRTKIDSLLKLNSSIKIIIMGDFNDEPDDKSLTSGLKACICIDTSHCDNLYNLTGCLLNNRNTIGTFKFHGHWNILDQVIVSPAIISNKTGLYATLQSASIFNASFLLKPDKSETGSSPFHTYNGYKYSGGFSDHLPILLNLYEH
jgi:endonuclease/exonuclease/phosphatase family metal-dependent hydrolase